MFLISRPIELKFLLMIEAHFKFFLYGKHEPAYVLCIKTEKNKELLLVRIYRKYYRVISEYFSIWTFSIDLLRGPRKIAFILVYFLPWYIDGHCSPSPMDPSVLQSPSPMDPSVLQSPSPMDPPVLQSHW